MTNAEVEPGSSIARVLRKSSFEVCPTLQPGIDALVNSYRLPVTAGLVQDLSLEDYMKAVNVNLTDAFFACQAAALQMISEGTGGTIVNVTSVGGVVALPEQAAFCSSMAALTAVTKVLATEWAHHGIRLVAVGAGLSSELVATARRLPANALVKAEAVAHAVRFLLSEEASAIAGVPLYVDGGWLSDGYWEAFP